MTQDREQLTDGPDNIEDQIGIKSLHVEDGVTTIETSQPPEVVAFFWASFKELLDKRDAPNFVQMEVKAADEVDRYMVTVQKVGGKTPVEKSNELREALEWTERNFRLAVQGKPVRDMAENLAFNDSVLGRVAS